MNVDVDAFTPRRGWAFGERLFDSQQGFFPLKLLQAQVLIARAKGASLVRAKRKGSSSMERLAGH